MPKLLFLLLSGIILLANSFSDLYAQSGVNYTLFGSYIDVSGQLVQGYTDQDYTPYRYFNISFNTVGNFTPGTYYTHDGTPRKGEFLYKPHEEEQLLTFRVDEMSKEEPLNLNLIKAFTLATDSFIIETNFIHYNKVGPVSKPKQLPRFLEHMGNTAKYSFFKYTPFNGTAFYLARLRGSQELISIPLARNAFVQQANVLFGEYPKLLQLLKEHKLDGSDIPVLIRFLQYTEAVQHNTPLYYTAYWQLTENKKSRHYSSQVSLQDNSWRVDYFSKSGQKIYTARFKYADPTQMEGEVQWFYHDGMTLRKKRSYKKGKADKAYFIYHSNGALHYQIQEGEQGRQKFLEVLSPEGQSLLDKSGSGKEQYYDEVAKRTLYREYKRHYLLTSYYTDTTNRTIYQLAQLNAKLTNTFELASLINEYVKYPQYSLGIGEEGIILARFIIGPDDQIEEISIISGLSTVANRLITGLVKSPSTKPVFRCGRQNRAKVYQEVIIPFQLSLIRQTPKPTHYYHNNHMWMLHPIHNPSLQHIKPPAMPGF